MLLPRIELNINFQHGQAYDGMPLNFLSTFLNGDISSLATKWWETWRKEKIPNIVICVVPPKR